MGADVELFLKQAVYDPEDFGALKESAEARIAPSVVATIVDPTNRDYLAEMGSLNGMLRRIHKELEFGEAQENDARAAEAKILISVAMGGYGALSFANPIGPGAIGQVISALAQPVITENIKTDSSVDVLKEGMDALRKDVLGVRTPIIQGLLNSGAIKPPADATWFLNGRIYPNAEYAQWASDNGEKVIAGRTLDEWVSRAQANMYIHGAG